MKHGKKYVDAAKLVDRTKLYDTSDALDTVIKTATAKFDETVEIHVKLGVDSRHADQQVRGAVVLPNGTGKKVRVLAICKGENEKLAQEAGADYVGAEDMTQKIQQENLETLMGAIVKAKPAAAKGQYIKSCAVTSTMGPSVRINPTKFGV